MRNAAPIAEGASRLVGLDGAVIAAYALGMVGIGVYYARRSAGAEDYLLGGRALSPWMVGISLFATLLSTLSYLTYPGEMIEFGPTIFGGLLALPIAYLIVARAIIPTLMNAGVTSAYEILERRLGLSVRLLASFFFLSLRLLWMATILHATADKVVVPLMGLGPGATPLVCALLGGVTLAYTTLGGLRAVVLTDVVQTVILVGGALLTLVLVSVELGGVAAWIPDTRPQHWPVFQLGFDTQSRMTLANSMLAVGSWYVCTAGSDQMAIQRFLATRDTRSAQRSLAVSVSANISVQLLLALVGLAVLSWFSADPARLPAGETLLTDSDRLFPLYVAAGLPAGVSGLVISGMMAAAMSSLSSGLNSASSVISEDWLGRLGKAPSDDAAAMRRARWISLLVGAVAITLSMSFGRLEGNLLDIVMRVVNLWVSPLFLLVFMALFVPWATTPGTWVGATAAVATAVSIAFYGLFDLGFLWIIPGSFCAGALAGAIASRILGPSPTPPRSGPPGP
jgi:SSS family solute:Na+ symporter